MPRLMPALCLALLAACGDKSVRYLVQPTPPAQQVALRARSVEVRDMVLPSYAEATEILTPRPDGGLGAIKNAVWGDSTAQNLTITLAASLAQRTRAEVAAEPWPLDQPPDARVEVRVERMLPRPDGSFGMAGQYAVSSPSGRLGEFLRRFDIAVPLTGEGPAAIAAAKGRAIDRLADDIVSRLRR